VTSDGFVDVAALIYVASYGFVSVTGFIDVA
jgi:hypothetical protein